MRAVSRRVVYALFAAVALVALFDFYIAVRERMHNFHLEQELQQVQRENTALSSVVQELSSRLRQQTQAQQQQTQAQQQQQQQQQQTQQQQPSVQVQQPPAPQPTRASSSASSSPGSVGAAPVARAPPQGLPAAARFLFEDPFWAAPQRHKAADALAAYVMKHNAITSGAAPAKYVLLKPAAQSGNRMVALVSSLALAIVTDRAFVVDYRGGFYASLADLFDSPGFELESGGANGGSTRRWDIANPRADVDLAEWLLCRDLRTVSEDVITIESNQFFARYLAYNEHHKARLFELFGGDEASGPLIFYTLSRFIFRPNAQVRQLVDETWNSRLAGKKTVGLQIRSMGFNSVRMFDWEYDVFKRCAERYSDEDTVWFVATDIDESQEHIRRAWGPSRDVQMVPFKRSNNPEGVRQAMADLLLLARCDHMVITSYSTYGAVAASWREGTDGVAIVTDKRVDADDGRRVSYGRFADGFHDERPQHGDSPMYMFVPQASEKREHCEVVSHNEPCFHYFSVFRPEKTSCFKPELITREMHSGKFC